MDSRRAYLEDLANNKRPNSKEHTSSSPIIIIYTPDDTIPVLTLLDMISIRPARILLLSILLLFFTGRIFMKFYHITDWNWEAMQ